MPVIFCTFIIPADLSFPASAQIPRTAATRFNQLNITNDQNDSYGKKYIEATGHQEPLLWRSSRSNPPLQRSFARETFHLISCWADVHPPAVFFSLTTPLCSLIHSLPKLSLPTCTPHSTGCMHIEERMCNRVEVPLPEMYLIGLSDSTPGTYRCRALGNY